MAFFAADGNLPFSVALVLMLGIALVETVAILLGGSLSHGIEDLLPTDVTADVPNAEAGVISHLLNWLRFGQVPALMLLVVFLTAFGLIGLGIQAVVGGLSPFLLPAWLAAVPAFAFALPVVRFSGDMLAKFMPKDETQSVSEASFVGRVAVITLGQARRGYAAQARLRDQHGMTHYVMVEPDGDADAFPQGAHVLLLSREGAVFKAILNTDSVVLDLPTNES